MEESEWCVLGGVEMEEETKECGQLLEAGKHKEIRHVPVTS
jgi:hypothetical protein